MWLCLKIGYLGYPILCHVPIWMAIGRYTLFSYTNLVTVSLGWNGLVASHMRKESEHNITKIQVFDGNHVLYYFIMLYSIMFLSWFISLSCFIHRIVRFLFALLDLVWLNTHGSGWMIALHQLEIKWLRRPTPLREFLTMRSERLQYQPSSAWHNTTGTHGFTPNTLQVAPRVLTWLLEDPIHLSPTSLVFQVIRRCLARQCEMTGFVIRSQKSLHVSIIL